MGPLEVDFPGLKKMQIFKDFLGRHLVLVVFNLETKKLNFPRFDALSKIAKSVQN